MSEEKIVETLKYNIELIYKITEKGKQFIDQNNINLEELREQFKESIKEVILDEADSNPELVKVSVIVTSY